MAQALKLEPLKLDEQKITYNKFMFYDLRQKIKKNINKKLNKVRLLRTNFYV